MKRTLLIFFLISFLAACAESNMNKDPDLDDNKTEYPPSSNQGSDNVYPSDSVAAKDTSAY